jgi:hypothetical protein
MPQVIQVAYQSEHEHGAENDPHLGNVRKPLTMRPQKGKPGASDRQQPDPSSKSTWKMTDADQTQSYPDNC